MEFGKMDMEDLLADESFINYCKGTVPADTARWEAFIHKHPDDEIFIENARTLFLNLFNAMALADLGEQEARLTSRLNMVDPAPVVQIQGYEGKKPKTLFSFLLKLTAAVIVVALAGHFILNNNSLSGKESLKIFQAAYGERKNFQLPDGSVVILNAGSKMHINERYGISARDIYLEGEAFFDVKHNKSVPFIVHTPAMDVKALGTAFNVKAYPSEKTTEASLVRGLVEVTLKEEKNRKVLLHPNEKVEWELPAAATEMDANKTAKERKLVLPANLVQHLTITDNNDIKEIAWTENKLIFDNETFADIALLLERWYGIKIAFADEIARSYRFTGIFEKEEIGVVLSFLKESRDFNYEIIQGDTLTVKIYQ